MADRQIFTVANGSGRPFAYYTRAEYALEHIYKSTLPLRLIPVTLVDDFPPGTPEDRRRRERLDRVGGSSDC